MALELSETAQNAMPVMIESVVQEILSAGGTCTPN